MKMIFILIKQSGSWNGGRLSGVGMEDLNRGQGRLRDRFDRQGLQVPWVDLAVVVEGIGCRQVLSGISHREV